MEIRPEPIAYLEDLFGETVDEDEEKNAKCDINHELRSLRAELNVDGEFVEVEINIARRVGRCLYLRHGLRQHFEVDARLFVLPYLFLHLDDEVKFF